MNKIKKVVIHIADAFDYYVIHSVVNLFYNVEGPIGDVVYKTQDKICDKIIQSDWWGEDSCSCFYCKKMEYNLDD